MEAWVRVFIDLLEVLFAAGWIGSILVLVLSGIEDAKTMFGPAESQPARK